MRRSMLFLAALSTLGGLASAADVQSISRLEAGPGNVLFVADWKAARVHAIELPPAQQKAAGTFNILDLEALLSRQLGGARLTVQDMAVRPGTGEVYVAVSTGPARTPALFAVTSDGKARRVDLKAARATSVALRDAPTGDDKFWKQTPERSFTVTDMKWRDGELFVAGLSNQEFSSTLRRIRFPFTAQQSASSIEIFHGGHNMMETRAPVRAMSFASLDGKPYLVAAYTCTPLVLIPIDALQDGAHVRGKTVAELGYGNTPADMISYTMRVGDKTEDYMMLVNFNRVSNVIPVSELRAANARPGIEKVVSFGQIAGLEVQQAPLAGALRIDNLDEQSFVLVRRRLETDALQLVSLGKDLSFRMTDHVSEYAFRGYSFKGDTWQQQNIKPRQDILLRQEGVPELIKPTE
ncbi:hypothetical protein C5614_23445 [Massilia phosphatilytica]|nr:hypothetical protein C5614_23445 [Massilia phosphatilytica]